MSTCKELLSEYPDPLEDLCYYHRKVRDGLIVNSNDDNYTIGAPFV